MGKKLKPFLLLICLMIFGVSVLRSEPILVSKSPVPDWEEMYLTYVSQSLWSKFKSAAISGHYAYVTVESGLLVFDVNGTFGPMLIGQIYLQEGYVQDVNTQGAYAYVAAYGKSDGPNSWLLRLYQTTVSNSQIPTIVASWTWSAPSPIRKVVVHGERAYVLYGSSSQESGLAIVDIPDHAQANLLGKVLLGLNDKIIVSGTTAFVTGAGDLKIVDVTDPTHPDSITAISGSSYRLDAMDISDDSTILYVINRDFFAFPEGHSAILILDITDPANPTEIHQEQFYSIALDVAVEGNRLYVCNGTCGLRVMDISDPTQPELLGTYRCPGNAFRTAVENEIVCVIDNGYIPSGDGPSATCPTADNPNGPYDGDFIVLDAADPAQPALKGFCSASGSVTGVAVRNDRMVALNAVQEDEILIPGAADLTIMEISSKFYPKVLSTYTRNGIYTDAFFVSDTVLLLAAGNQGMDILNLSDPQHPALFSNYPVSGDVVDVHSVGSYAFLAAQSGGVFVVDISQPAFPEPVATISTAVSAMSVDVTWPYVYVAGTRLQAFDVSNPYIPVEIDYVDSAFNQVQIDGSRLYACNESGFCIFDISNPADIQILGSYDEGIAISAMAKSGDHVFLTNDEDGIQAFDVNNVSAIMPAGSYNTTGSPGTPVLAKPYMFIPDYTGLLILLFDTPTSVAEPDKPDVPSDFVLHQNYPNPFNAGTVIAFELKKRAKCELRIYDLLGRCVKTLVDGPLSANRYSVNWDGTNGDNTPAASGVYWYRLDVAGTKLSKKMVLVR